METLFTAASLWEQLQSVSTSRWTDKWRICALWQLCTTARHKGFVWVHGFQNRLHDLWIHSAFDLWEGNRSWEKSCGAKHPLWPESEKERVWKEGTGVPLSPWSCQYRKGPTIFPKWEQTFNTWTIWKHWRSKPQPMQGSSQNGDSYYNKWTSCAKWKKPALGNPCDSIYTSL